MDCNNAIGVVRVGGEVVVEARRTGKGNFYLLFRMAIVLRSGWHSSNSTKTSRYLAPLFLKLQRIHNPVYFGLQQLCGTTAPHPPPPDAVAWPSLRVGLT